MNYVYTPAGYGEDSCDTGRVGVLECASDERDFCWIHQGKIANIMDNLSGEGRIKGIMIIMADSTISDDIIGNITDISKGGKKVVQTISYLPHFLSWIIVTGILHDMLSGTGIVNEFLVNMHIIDQPINFFAHTGYFWPIVAFANVWKETGWNAIIYLAAITSIDPSLYEAASIDGAGRWAKIKYVTLPGIKPTIIILLLMNVGNVLNAGFEIQYLLGNGLIQKVSQTIDIYVLKWGISQGDYAIGTAAGIFKSAVSIILICIANKIAKHSGEEQLF